MRPTKFGNKGPGSSVSSGSSSGGGRQVSSDDETSTDGTSSFVPTIDDDAKAMIEMLERIKLDNTASDRRAADRRIRTLDDPPSIEDSTSDKSDDAPLATPTGSNKGGRESHLLGMLNVQRRASLLSSDFKRQGSDASPTSAAGNASSKQKGAADYNKPSGPAKHPALQARRASLPSDLLKASMSSSSSSSSQQNLPVSPIRSSPEKDSDDGDFGDTQPHHQHHHHHHHHHHHNKNSSPHSPQDDDAAMQQLHQPVTSSPLIPRKQFAPRGFRRNSTDPKPDIKSGSSRPASAEGGVAAANANNDVRHSVSLSSIPDRHSSQPSGSLPGGGGGGGGGSLKGLGSLKALRSMVPTSNADARSGGSRSKSPPNVGQDSNNTTNNNRRGSITDVIMTMMSGARKAAGSPPPHAGENDRKEGGEGGARRLSLKDAVLGKTTLKKRVTLATDKDDGSDKDSKKGQRRSVGFKGEEKKDGKKSKESRKSVKGGGQKKSLKGGKGDEKRLARKKSNESWSSSSSDSDSDSDSSSASSSFNDSSNGTSSKSERLSRASVAARKSFSSLKSKSFDFVDLTARNITSGVRTVENRDHWSYAEANKSTGDKSKVYHTIRMDPYNVRRALDPSLWPMIRYMEGVVIQRGKGHDGYYSMVVCEDRLMFLPLANPGFKGVTFREWFAKGSMVVIPAHEIVSVGYVRGEEFTAKLWENNYEMKTRSVHIKLNLISIPEDEREVSSSAEFHLYTYEAKTRAMYHIAAMWTNCYTRMKARLEVERNESALAEASDFFTEIVDVTHSPNSTLSEQIKALSMFSSEAVNDIQLKKLFFNHSELCTYCLRTMASFTTDMHKNSLSKSTCFLLLRRLVCAFKAIYSALFNSQQVPERWAYFNLGDRIKHHMIAYTTDFTAFLHVFDEQTGLSEKKLNISDARKLTNLRKKRQTMGNETRSRGGLSRATMGALTTKGRGMAASASKEHLLPVNNILSALNFNLDEMDEDDDEDEEKDNRGGNDDDDDDDDDEYAVAEKSKFGGKLKNTPYSPRMTEENVNMFHVLSDSLLDHQHAVLIELHLMTEQYNLERNSGKFVVNARDTVAHIIRDMSNFEVYDDSDSDDERGAKAAAKAASIVNLKDFFANIYQRMITLMEEIKTDHTHTNGPTQDLLDKLDVLNITGETWEALEEHARNGEMIEPVHRLNHPTIAIYHHSRLLYNLVQDHKVMREIAILSGAEELCSFVGSAENLFYLYRSSDVHLLLTATFIKKSMKWMGLEPLGLAECSTDMQLFLKWDIESEVDIE